MDLCRQCKLRISGVPLSGVYHYTDSELQACLQDEEEKNNLGKPLRETKICDCCLGTLQINFTSIAQRVKQICEKKGYKFPNSQATFSICVTLDPHIYLRQRFAELTYTRDKSEDTTYITDIKRCFRFLASRYIPQATGYEYDQKNSGFSILCKITHSSTIDGDMKLFHNLDMPCMKKFTTSRVPEYVKDLTIEHFQCILPIAHTDVPVEVCLDAKYKSIYIGGRYLKYKRNICNSKWIYGGNRTTSLSVEELLIKEIANYFQCEKHKFYSSGREDSDALMLGNGRPFYYELIDPKIVVRPPMLLKNLEYDINKNNVGLVGVSHLAVISEKDVDILKKSASTKNKRYRALVEIPREILPYEIEILCAIKNLSLHQRTPTRISSRADLIRERVILDIQVYPALERSRELNAFLLECNLSTTAGTYVKEFVSGDDGRTEPSLKSILNCEYAIVRELDVLEVCLDWPVHADTGQQANVKIASQEAP